MPIKVYLFRMQWLYFLFSHLTNNITKAIRQQNISDNFHILEIIPTTKNIINNCKTFFWERPDSQRAFIYNPNKGSSFFLKCWIAHLLHPNRGQYSVWVISIRVQAQQHIFVVWTKIQLCIICYIQATSNNTYRGN